MRFFSFIFLIIITGSIFSSCKEEVKQEEKYIRPVKYETVGYLNGSKIRTFSGTAQTDKIINLSFRNTGIITKFNIKLGQKVRQGELLGQLDNVQARLAYEQSVTQLNSAKSQMNTTKLSLNRIRSLFEKGSASLSDFEAAKNSYKTAVESYKSAKRGVDIQKEQIGYGYLYAPENGVISKVMSELDENISPGQTVAILNSGKDMEITIGLPESVINWVELGMEVAVDFPSLPGKKYQGKVTEIAPAVDVNSSTYPVLVTLSAPDEAIKSGMASNVSFDFGSKKRNKKEQVLIVPANAVGEDNKGTFVFTVDGEGDNVRVKKQHVTIGSLSGEGFVIKSGLKAGQKIATAGLQTLLDGQEVRLQ